MAKVGGTWCKSCLSSTSTITWELLVFGWLFSGGPVAKGGNFWRFGVVVVLVVPVLEDGDFAVEHVFSVCFLMGVAATLVCSWQVSQRAVACEEGCICSWQLLHTLGAGWGSEGGESSCGRGSSFRYKMLGRISREEDFAMHTSLRPALLLLREQTICRGITPVIGFELKMGKFGANVLGVKKR